MILTVRTDRPEAEVGLFDGHKRLVYETWPAHRQLAEMIHQKIQTLLASQDKTWQDISGLVVYKGPGSFTGLRIGISVSNALAYGLDIPIVATGGKHWVSQGIDQLLARRGKKLVLPEYGSPVHITKPKK